MADAFVIDFSIFEVQVEVQVGLRRGAVAKLCGSYRRLDCSMPRSGYPRFVRYRRIRIRSGDL